MALVVETGAGLSTANTYISEADTDTYFIDHNSPTAWSGATTAAKETALIMGTQYVDVTYSKRWKGTRKLETQRLAWPRVDVTDFDGFILSAVVLPRNLIEATAEAALRHITEAVGLLVDVDSGGIKREAVQVGPIKEDIEYAGSKDEQKTFTIIARLIKDLIVGAAFVERA